MKWMKIYIDFLCSNATDTHWYLDLGIHSGTSAACSECNNDGSSKLGKKTYFYLCLHILFQVQSESKFKTDTGLA